MSGMVDARPKNSAPLPARPGKSVNDVRRSKPREQPVCLALPRPAQPSPAHLESPSIGGAEVCIVLLLAIKWDGPAQTWDGGERRKRDQDRPALASRGTVPASLRGKRYECLALATSRHCRRSCSRYWSLGQSPTVQVQPARLT